MKPLLALLACAVMLSGCAGVIDRCKDGLFPGEPGKPLSRR